MNIIETRDKISNIAIHTIKRLVLNPGFAHFPERSKYNAFYITSVSPNERNQESA